MWYVNHYSQNQRSESSCINTFSNEIIDLINESIKLEPAQSTFVSSTVILISPLRSQIHGAMAAKSSMTKKKYSEIQKKIRNSFVLFLLRILSGLTICYFNLFEWSRSKKGVGTCFKEGCRNLFFESTIKTFLTQLRFPFYFITRSHTQYKSLYVHLDVFTRHE